MKSDCEVFFDRMDAELDDLLEHIAQMEEELHRLRDEHVSTEHVYHENLAVLGNEACCVRGFKASLESLREDPDDDVEGLATKAREAFKSHINRCGFAPCAYLFADRKLDKVARYIADGHGG